MKIKKLKNIVARLILLLLVVSLFYWWIGARNQPFTVIDSIWLLIGVGSVAWIVIWTKTKRHSKQTLMVPYFPIFAIPAIGIILNQLNLISGSDVLNMMILFYCGFMAPISFMGSNTSSSAKKQ